MVTKLVGVKEFRQNIATFYKQAIKNDWRFIILNRNKPIFEVKPLNEKEAILEKLAVDVAEAREDFKRGRFYSLEEVKRDFGL